MMTTEQEASSNDDAIQKTSASAEEAEQARNTGEPWWATDPTIIAAREAALRWIESAAEQAVPNDNFGQIHDDVGSGSCWRELRDAREDLARARARYANAVSAAWAVGFSWGEIGRLLGVPRQQLHRRFRNEVD